MCNACGFHCCAFDDMSGCGCDGCAEPACWSSPLDEEMDGPDFEEERPPDVRTKNFDIAFGTVLENARQISHFIHIDPAVHGGTPVIIGTRVPVYVVVNAVEEFGTVDGAIEEYGLTLDQVNDALQFAANVLESPVASESTRPEDLEFVS